MQVSDIKDWTSVVSGGLAIGAIIYAWLMSRSEKNTGRLTALEGVVASHAKCLDRIEVELKHLPTKDEVNELKLSISAMSGELKALRATMQPMGETIRRIDDYLHEMNK